MFPRRLREYPRLQRYVAAMACVAAAAATRWSLTPLLGTRYPYLLQFLAVLVSARYFGFGPALIGLLIGTSPMVFGVEFVTRPLQARGWQFWLSVGAIYGISTLLIWIVDRHRRLRREVRSSTRLAGERLEQLAIEVEQREREQRLSAQLRAIVESSEDAIIHKDLDGIIRSWNFGAEQIYGYAPQEVIGKSVNVLVPPERLHEELDLMERIRHGGRVKHFETIRLRKDQTQIHVSMTVSPIRDPAGQIVGVSHISRDITERRQLEEQLRQTQKLESLGVLAGGIAHDFNNLLTGIIGNASFAMGEIPDGHPARKAVGQVLAAGDRAALLIRQMLAYAGKGRFATSRLNLSEQVSQILPLIDTSLGREVRIDLHLSQDLPLIEADASQIQQVIMNLTINGSEAIGDTPGVLTLSTFARESDSEQQVILEVRDTGCGMDEATSARIFDPFFTTKFTGRGLGLSAVLGIIRGHHGYISVESVPGYGSTFTVALPAAQASETGSLQVRGYGHLLVVDDEEVVRNLARFTLERSGYTVETAPDGTSALARLSAPSAVFDAVLLDLLMPGPSGEEIARMLLDASPGTRIVLCSSLSDSEAQTRFEGIGIAAFLQKPYTAAALTRKVKLALKRNVASAP